MVVSKIVGRRQKMKYEKVLTEQDDVDVETTKRKLFSPQRVWAMLSTSLLIGLYFIPSIGLTFYQRKLLQVNYHWVLNFKFGVKANVTKINAILLFKYLLFQHRDVSIF